MGCGSSTQAGAAKKSEAKAADKSSPSSPTKPASPDGRPKRRYSYQSPEMSVPDPAGGGNLNPFPANVVGTYSNHGIKPGPYGKPAAKINQDRGLITYPLADDRSMALLAVYDGHGTNGEQVSEYAMLAVPDKLEAKPDRLWDDTPALLKSAFETTDQELLDGPIRSDVSGSTGVAVLLQGRTIWTANVGDSRAVIGRKAGGGLKVQPLTIDQKPDTPAEKERILAAGGYVSAESPQFGPARVWLRPGEGPGLAMARSIGDHVCKRVGVISTPEVKRFESTAEDTYLVLASDGVWEFISDEEAIDIVAKHHDAQQGCIALINEATTRWRKEEGNYRDDITAIVVHLPLALQNLSRGAGADDVPPAAAVAAGGNAFAEPSHSIKARESEGEEEGGEPQEHSFQKRRLSVAIDVSEAVA